MQCMGSSGVPQCEAACVKKGVRRDQWLAMHVQLCRAACEKGGEAYEVVGDPVRLGVVGVPVRWGMCAPPLVGMV